MTRESKELNGFIIILIELKRKNYMKRIKP
jgi:hypothetical protein